LEHSVPFGLVVGETISSIFFSSKLAPMRKEPFPSILSDGGQEIISHLQSVFAACFVLFFYKDSREFLCHRGEVDKAARSIQKAKADNEVFKGKGYN